MRRARPFRRNGDHGRADGTWPSGLSGQPGYGTFDSRTLVAVLRELAMLVITFALVRISVIVRGACSPRRKCRG